MPSASGIHYFAHEPQGRAAKRPPVILIHGAGGNLLSWPPQIRRLSDQRVFAVDLPGHGKSEGVGRHSIEEYVEDIVSFMEFLKLRTAILAGISMGGGIALAFALKYPKKVSGLVLLGSGAKLRVAPSILESLGNPNLYEAGVERVNSNCFSDQAPAQLKELSKRIMIQMRPATLLGDFLACDQFNVTDKLDQMTIPTLIVCGAGDKMTPLKYSESLRDSISGARLQIVEGAGHLVMAEQPEIVADLLAQFLITIPSGARR